MSIVDLIPEFGVPSSSLPRCFPLLGIQSLAVMIKV
jgi:hypothetical protein